MKDVVKQLDRRPPARRQGGSSVVWLLTELWGWGLVIDIDKYV